VATLAIWVEVTTGVILTICSMWADNGRNHMCNLWWLSVWWEG